MTSSDCCYYNGTESEDGCSAPICPMDEHSINNCVWFPDEEVCRRLSVPNWVRKQRKIVERLGDRSTCWTVRMLEKITRICSGATGINPDRDPVEAEQSWLNSVSGQQKTRTYTDEQRQAMREAFLSRIQKKKDTPSAVTRTNEPSDPIKP